VGCYCLLWLVELRGLSIGPERLFAPMPGASMMSGDVVKGGMGPVPSGGHLLFSVACYLNCYPEALRSTDFAPCLVITS
jgi:hypothetical protein